VTEQLKAFITSLIVAIIPPTILSLAAWREAAAARKHAAEVARLLRERERRRKGK